MGTNYEEFIKIFNDTTKKAAVAAYKEITRLHETRSDPETRDYKALGRLIDRAAVEAMQDVFETQPHFYIEIKGSEGRKDTRRDGIESPDLYGSYGPKEGTPVEIVNDAVEGTSFASRNIPGAGSVLAAVLNCKNGLTPTGNFDYMSKLFGPPQLNGKISLDLSPLENIKIALKELKIQNPAELAVVILDRPRNQFEIESASKAGVTTILIPGGDLVPGLLAVSDPSVIPTLKNSRIPKTAKAVLVMGSGGWEEGVIVAAAARASGGAAQGRIYSEDKELIEQAKIMDAGDLVPADPSSILVSITSITGDEWFGIPGVSGNSSSTIFITSNGLNITRNTSD
jgi:fructose-1,6-bisphosphatase/sedoheptulose 1,7-bisphosphatase-like protein